MSEMSTSSAMVSMIPSRNSEYCGWAHLEARSRFEDKLLQIRVDLSLDRDCGSERFLSRLLGGRDMEVLSRCEYDSLTNSEKNAGAPL